jgi:hypothetical protein
LSTLAACNVGQPKIAGSDHAKRELRSRDLDRQANAIAYLDDHPDAVDDEAARLLFTFAKKGRYTKKDATLALGRSGHPLAGKLLMRLLGMAEDPPLVADGLNLWLRARGRPVLTAASVHVTPERSTAQGCTPVGTTAHKKRRVAKFSEDAAERFADTVVLVDQDGAYLGEIYRCRDRVAEALGVKQAPAPAAPAPAAAPRPPSPAGGDDVVHLRGGGRVRGTVVVDDSAEVLVRLHDGTQRRLPRAEVERIDYGR